MFRRLYRIWLLLAALLIMLVPAGVAATGGVPYSAHPEIDIVVLVPETTGNFRTSDLDVDRLLGDNFTLTTATTIHTVEWWGWYSPQDDDVDYLDDFTLEIYRLVNGSPEAAPVYARQLGDIVENAVPSPSGGYLGNSPLVPQWSVNASGLVSPSRLQIHRYVADLCGHPIVLEAGDYLISIFNNKPEQGAYIFGDEVEFVGTGDFSNWNWHRLNSDAPELDGPTWVRTSSDGWAPECTGTPCGAGDDLIRYPDVSFQLYESRLGLEIVTGTAQPILYTADNVGIPLVYRVSNLRVGDAVYDVNFRNNLPGVVFDGETDFDAAGATAAADALNAALNAANPIPRQTQSNIDGETQSSPEFYSIPFFRSGSDTVSVESSGPDLPDIPPASSTWRRTSDASATAGQALSLADFSLLDGQVEPFELASADLIAGAGNARSAVTVGRVRAVTADGRSFSLIYEIEQPGWCLAEVHAHVADTIAGIPQTRRGNPKVGHFQYGEANVGCQGEYIVPGISLETVAGSFVVAAHANVERQEGDLVLYETAWAAGTPFPGQNWATYMEARICQ